MASVQAAEVIQQAAVAETARVLIAAGLIEAEATTEVIETLLAADLIKQEALDEAREVVEQANAEVAAIKAAQAQTNGALPPSETVPVGSENA
jgi:predicted nucleic-acid-binding protein